MELNLPFFCQSRFSTSDSKRLTASTCTEGTTWEYKSPKIPMVPCPKRPETTLRWIPVSWTGLRWNKARVRMLLGKVDLLLRTVNGPPIL